MHEFVGDEAGRDPKVHEFVGDEAGRDPRVHEFVGTGALSSTYRWHR